MRRIRQDISHADLRTYLIYDASTGWLTWRIARAQMSVGDRAGKISAFGYRRIKLFGIAYSVGRLAWFYEHAAWPDGEIDHINRDRDDNRLVNLRVVTSAQNQWNRKYRRDDTGQRGGVWNKHVGKWQSIIKENGRSHYLGLFDRREDAIAAYRAAQVIYHGDFARHG